MGGPLLLAAGRWKQFGPELRGEALWPRDERGLRVGVERCRRFGAGGDRLPDEREEPCALGIVATCLLSEGLVGCGWEEVGAGGGAGGGGRPAVGDEPA